MSFLSLPLLSTIVFLPLAGALALALVPRERHEAIRGFTLGLTTLVFALSLSLYAKFDDAVPGFHFVETAKWIPAYGISYKLGIDGISILLVLLTTFLMPITILSSWTAIAQRVKEFHIAMLLLETGMLGVFTSLDLVLFYVFWEAMLIPMYLIIGVWGGERRIYAAIKFFIYTMVGSLLMLVAILWLYLYHYRQTSVYTFDLEALLSIGIPAQLQMWMFLAFALSFAIKVPVFPFHTWLPDAHVEAPTAGSVILAGVLLKMGTYGYLRFCLPLFPDASYRFAPAISVLAVVGIIYGALVAMVQPDVKKLVAYSSVSHLGFVMLGIFAFTLQGQQGGILQMVNHGLSTGALFLIVGMLYERRHTRLISDFGGLARPMPVFATLFMIVMLSSIGLPGLNGFVGEFLVLVGTFLAHRTYAVLAATGVVLAAVYMLWMYQRVMFGPCDKTENQRLRDINVREILVLVPIVALILWIGVYPRPFLKKTEASVKALLETVELKRQASQPRNLFEQAGIRMAPEEAQK
jgi:NADH-quinone oxidoreductase subunit M